MPMIDSFLTELDQESHATRRLLERIPEDKLGWRPHAKSMTLGQLALHVAQMPGRIAEMALADGMEATKFSQPEAASRQQLIETLDSGLASAQDNLAGMDDQRLMSSWNVTHRGEIVMPFSRVGLLRTFLLNHVYHHRGQLTVYLRLLDVSLPSVYGPSADESPLPC